MARGGALARATGIPMGALARRSLAQPEEDEGGEQGEDDEEADEEDEEDGLRCGPLRRRGRAGRAAARPDSSTPPPSFSNSPLIARFLLPHIHLSILLHLLRLPITPSPLLRETRPPLSRRLWWRIG